MTETDEIMEHIAAEVINVLREKGFDNGHIEHVRHLFSKMDRLDVLLWCDELDSDCKVALAKKLGVDVDSFNITLDTLIKI